MSRSRMSDFFQYGPQLDINATEYAVLCELSRHENEDTHVCCPSIPTLAYHCHTSRNTIINAIQYLQKMGILTIERRTDKTNRTTSHAYTIDIKGKIGVEHPKRKRPKKKKKDDGTKFQPSQGTNFAPSQGSNFVPSTSVQNLDRNNNGSLNNCIPNNTNPNYTTTHPIQSHSPRAHAKGGALMGYVVEGSVEVASPEKETDGSECDLPMTAMMDAKRPPQGYPDEDKFNAFAKTLVLNPNYENTILQAAKYVFEQMCKQGFADAAGNYFKNWRKYARSSIAKLVDDANRHIINWDDSLVNIRDVTPAEIGQWRPQSTSEPQSKPAEQPQKPLPPPTEERKPDPKPEQPPVEIPAVEPQPPKRSTEEIIRADPTTFRTASVARLRLEREETARRARAIAVSSGHAEGVYYRGND